jgi:hypothetical protein
MTRNILFWAITGCIVAGLWAVYVLATFPSPSISADPIIRTLISVTCPIAFASFHFHFGIKLYWVLIANAATYACVGLAVECLRQELAHAR